ncbi:hypothetical protein LX16_2219 [Stackebrandtia albiflava]|uniref:Uncharacterized protein n=1 Tax=Stackebrandtia albiflava TaxID=406432 RepID=A0A562V118_9ACTN|nr:hypothetical protein [Stackebrandtia albiflava]TWJ11497.1 hypothetical protein LX16_2219 [Stackebrandtia albiflava]
MNQPYPYQSPPPGGAPYPPGPPPPPPSGQVPGGPPPITPPGAPAAKPPRNHTGIIIAVIVVVLLGVAVCGGGAWYLFGGGAETIEDATTPQPEYPQAYQVTAPPYDGAALTGEDPSDVCDLVDTDRLGTVMPVVSAAPDGYYDCAVTLNHEATFPESGHQGQFGVTVDVHPDVATADAAFSADLDYWDGEDLGTGEFQTEAALLVGTETDSSRWVHLVVRQGALTLSVHFEVEDRIDGDTPPGVPLDVLRNMAVDTANEVLNGLRTG